MILSGGWKQSLLNKDILPIFKLGVEKLSYQFERLEAYDQVEKCIKNADRKQSACSRPCHLDERICN